METVVKSAEIIGRRESSLRWLLRMIIMRAGAPFGLSVIQQLCYAVAPVALAAAVGGLAGAVTGVDVTWFTVWPWVLLLLVGYMLQQSFVLDSYKQYLYQKRLQAGLDEPILVKINRLPLISFEDAGVRDLISRTRNPSMRVQQLCEDLLHTSGSWLQIGFLAVYIGSAFWWLSIPIILLSLVHSRIEMLIGRQYQMLERKLSVPERERHYLGGLLTDRGGAMEAKVFGLGAHLIGRWKRWFTYVHHARLRHDRRMLLPATLMNLFQGIILLAGIVLLAWLIERAGGGFAQFASAVVALLSLLDAASMISWNARHLGEGITYVDEVRQLLDLPEETKKSVGTEKTEGAADTVDTEQTEGTEEIEGTKETEVAEVAEDTEVTVARVQAAFSGEIRAGIRLEGVTFTYPGQDKPSVRNVSLHIRPGEKVALVGANGSGKSTLIKLILGLYEPDTGKITIDGVDLRDYEPSSLRKAMSVVFQDFGRYSLTARENIGLGQLDLIHDDDAIRHAAKMADAASFIERLADQYDTPFGRLAPNSHEPSGGEWQKIAISRSLLRDTPVLLFDEPTSALDPIAEANLYTYISDLLRGRTAILVTHRLGSVHTCDRIVVMHEGEVVEHGDHASLLAADRLYARMYASQADWYKEMVI